MSIIYRVEHKRTEAGPYTQNGSVRLRTKKLKNILLAHTGSPDHPTIKEDVCVSKHEDPLQLHWSFLFGFIDLDQLKNWFDVEVRQLLHDSKFVLAIYEPKSKNFDLRIFEKQCVFDMYDFQKTKTLSLLDI